jgi:hypothetical protein
VLGTGWWLGYVEYNGKLEGHNSLLNVALYDKPEIKRKDASKWAGILRLSAFSGPRSTVTARDLVGNWSTSAALN